MKKLGGKKILVGALSAVLAAGSAMTAFAAPGWNQNTTGWWWENADGSYVVNNWVQDAGKWYFMDGNGYMSCGWIWDNGNWYFADASGAMLTGWVRVDGAVYYLNPVSDGTQGAMATGVRTIDGVSYTFDASGACMNSGSYNRTEIPSYNGNGTVAAVPVEAHASRPSGGGSSSGGSSTTTPTTPADLNEEVENAANAVAESSEAVAEAKVTTTGTADNTVTTVEVTMEENIDPDMTVEEAVGGVLETVVDAINDEDVTVVTYRDMKFDLANKDNAVKMLRDRAENVKVANLQESYQVTLTLVSGDTATYVINLK